MANPFTKQQSMAASRALRPEDSVSNISSSSWTWQQVHYHEDDLPPGDLELPKPVDLMNKIPKEERSVEEASSQPAGSQAAGSQAGPQAAGSQDGQTK